jgi:hypothetical protein
MPNDKQSVERPGQARSGLPGPLAPIVLTVSLAFLVVLFLTIYIEFFAHG